MLLLRKGHLGQLENSEYLSLTDAERGQLKDIRPAGKSQVPSMASFGLGSLKSGVLTLRPLQMSTFRLHGACTMSAKSALWIEIDRDREETSSRELDELLVEVQRFSPTPQQMEQVLALPEPRSA